MYLRAIITFMSPTPKTVSQGDIIEIEVEINKLGTTAKHPVIVVSNESVHKLEPEMYIGVMCTGSNTNDKFTYLIEDQMVAQPFTKMTQVRTQLITRFYSKDVISNNFNNKLKEKYIRKLVKKIEKSVFRP